jgi:hypothetical protein
VLQERLQPGQHDREAFGRLDGLPQDTFTCAETPYMSQCQVTRAPGTSRPEPRVNQNRRVIAGSTNAWNMAPLPQPPLSAA